MDIIGWDRNSYGYHADDGNFFSSSGNGTQYGPTFTTNDVVGCGFNLIDNTIFYTKNGQNLGRNSDINLVSLRSTKLSQWGDVIQRGGLMK